MTALDLRHLLEDGELPGLVRGLEILKYEEGWTEEGQHEARLVARRTAPLRENDERCLQGTSYLTAGPGRSRLDVDRMLKAGNRVWSRRPHRALCDARLGFFHAPVPFLGDRWIRGVSATGVILFPRSATSRES